MNSMDVLRYGHHTVLQNVENLPDPDWLTPGACGVWSVKDIVAHLASFEVVLVEVLESLAGEAPTPALDRFISDNDRFNDLEVDARAALSREAVWAEYESACHRTIDLIAEVPVAQQRQNGALPWYGLEYDLEDFIVYTFYGHKREHAAQIAFYRDALRSPELSAAMRASYRG
jgi:hypothetical protein